jgi:hypothetical protein
MDLSMVGIATSKLGPACDGSVIQVMLADESSPVTYGITMTFFRMLWG